MNIFKRVREAAKRFAEAVQERAREVVERAKERFRKEEKEPEQFTFSDLQDYLSEQKKQIEFPKELFETEEESLSEKLKREDLEKRIKQHEDAYETFKNNYYEDDEEFTREAYDLMWDTIGAVSNEFSERVPSPPMIELYEDMRYKFGAELTKDFFQDFFREAANSFEAEGMYAEEFIDLLYAKLERIDSVEDFYDTIYPA